MRLHKAAVLMGDWTKTALQGKRYRSCVYACRQRPCKGGVGRAERENGIGGCAHLSSGVPGAVDLTECLQSVRYDS